MNKSVEIKPGPELDAVLAEKWMGYKIVGFGHWWNPDGGGWTPHESGDPAAAYLKQCFCGDLKRNRDIEDIFGVGHDWQCLEKVKPYTRDQNAALELVMRDPEVRIEGKREQLEGPVVWTVDFYETQCEPGKDEKFELAVCKAVMNAVREGFRYADRVHTDDPERGDQGAPVGDGADPEGTR